MYLLNADYLEFRCKDESGYVSYLTDGSNKIYIISHKLKLAKTVDLKYYSQRFFKCFDVLLNDMKIGYLYSDPIRNLYYSANDILSIRIDNEVLYSQSFSEILGQVLTELQLTIKGITRLDIAYDTDVDILKRFRRFYNNIEKYTFKNRGKTIVNGTGRYDTQINIGSLKGQGKTIIIYDKSTLLRQQSKDYIIHLFEAVFGNQNVYRCEVQLTSKTLNKYDIDILKLGDKAYLEQIFGEFCESLIDFRRKDDSNVSRQTKIDFLELNRCSVELPRRVGTGTVKVDNYVKHMIWKLYCDSQKEEFKDIARELRAVVNYYVEMLGLVNWLKKKVKKEGLDL
jgi:hypothetical protein